jgi:hypothetical protein
MGGTDGRQFAKDAGGCGAGHAPMPHGAPTRNKGVRVGLMLLGAADAGGGMGVSWTFPDYGSCTSSIIFSFR